MTDDDPDPTPALLAHVERGVGGTCRTCGGRLCGHEVVMSFVLGFKDSPRCLDCLAQGLGRERATLREELEKHIHHRECWTRGWRRADELEGVAMGASPACLARAPQEPATTAAPDRGNADAPRRVDDEWDAGDLGCGDLVLELRLRLRALKPGQVIAVVARDPGAPEDLPAWCGLTGHKMLEAHPPRYLIQRKED